jgi:excisionase family DNA binding protein
MQTNFDSLVAAARAIALPDVVSVEELARHIGLSDATVRDLIRSGAIPGKKLGRRWFVSREALIRSLSRQEVEHAS